MTTDLYLVDASVWIFALRNNPVQAIKNRVESLLKDDRVAVNLMITMEILSGTKSKTEFSRLSSRLGALNQIRIDDAVWQSAAELGFDLRRKGLTVPNTDLLIASSALKAGAIVLHSDAHFDWISTKTDLKVESHLQLVQ